MKIRILKGTNTIGGAITEITSKKARIILDFGTDLDDIERLPVIEGLTHGKPSYNAVFIRTPDIKTITEELTRYFLKYLYISQI